VKEKRQKIPSLDGWRTVSISMVLLAHSTFTPGFPTVLNPLLLDWFWVGAVGVRFFFVISGFLITYLLLQEQKENGFINLGNFYLRRILRIFPVYFLYLFVLGCLTNYSQSRNAWLANLTFTTNFITVPPPTAHLWSLGVEEQFYVLWPGIIYFILKKSNDFSKLASLLIVPIIVAPLMRMMGAKQWYPASWRIWFGSGSFFVCFDSLAYGCLMAILLTYRRRPVEIFFGKNFTRITCAAISLIIAPTILRAVHFPGRLQAAFFDSMHAVGFALLMLQSILYPAWKFYRFLNWKWISHLGILSYSIYIWQQMFCGTDETVFGVKGAWWVTFPVWILIALISAHLSYFLIEKPLAKLRSKLHARRLVATG
jgi:peptidoglycan/LPS O-acetylase OafA/YrhL